MDLCCRSGMNVDDFVHRFTFFFDSSISLFEEVAKFRAGRRLWARLLQERFGAKNPRSLRFKFHAQTSGVDLTQQQPINNIARVALQALAERIDHVGDAGFHCDHDPEHYRGRNRRRRRDRSARGFVLRRDAYQRNGTEGSRGH
ncbi:MAG: hypothetical protein DMG58_33725 [Acidobacteria bacterium]|nr:MAG: hypothetical protein DMG58_33725 [Acidobacteriota bacterium]